LVKLERNLDSKLNSNEIYNVENDSQITDFLNYIYRPAEEYLFDSHYKLISVYDKDILSVIWKFTHKFDKKTPLAFTASLNEE
jgi:hypothetical protein